MDLVAIGSSNPHPVRRLGAIIGDSGASRRQCPFQSSPSPKTGRYSNLCDRFMDLLFQSSPSPKTGRYSHNKPINISKTFQSSPSPKTGRYCPLPLAVSGWSNRSNPHPVRRLGAISPIAISSSRKVGSNPHPVRRLGAIKCVDSRGGDVRMFQSSPSPKTGRYSLRRSIFHAAIAFQSSPSPKTGRYAKGYV